MKLRKHIAATSAAPQKPVRVLIADDNFLFAAALEMALQLESDLEVAGHAQNGKEALELAAALRPDVVLMDLDMPVMDGIEATWAMNEVATETRVVIVTASSSTEDEEEALAAGAVGYLRKGCSATELVGGIRAAVEALPVPLSATA